MSRGPGLTNVERWRIRMAEEADQRDRRDPGTLEPCGYCGGGHEPGYCSVGDDSAGETGKQRDA